MNDLTSSKNPVRFRPSQLQAALRSDNPTIILPGKTKQKQNPSKNAGKLKIGDDWNAITIIALSQNNPLKAIAEFVENSIDAKAKNIVITRGREKKLHYLRIKDDGEGIRRNEQGEPDFRYVATHICDSIKRRLKTEGAVGLQGEFGIGLLSFWTVGEEMFLTASSEDGKTYRMHMVKGKPEFKIARKPSLFPEEGTEVLIRPVLPGLKQLSGEKIQWYLASELRDRIRNSDVHIRVLDRVARTEFKVEPRKFEGRLLHSLQKLLPTQSEIYLELYLTGHAPDHHASLYRHGTRVLEDLAELELFQRPPWTSGFLQGIVEAPFVNLTPGNRLGVIRDHSLERLRQEIAEVEIRLVEIIEEQRRAEEEQTSREVLKSIQRALKEALLALPAEEYDWFNIRRKGGKSPQAGSGETQPPEEDDNSLEAEQDINEDPQEGVPEQKQFFEYAGPLFSVKISPASSVVSINQSRNFAALARDRSRHRVEKDLSFHWQIAEGNGVLENVDQEMATFHAPAEPGLVRLRLEARQSDLTCNAEALVTVTDSILPETSRGETDQQGIPGYTFQKAPSQLWRSRFDGEQNVVVINNGHRDFVYASKTKALKLRYICRLFAKELVVKNFAGVQPDQLLERLVELTLYTEENLK